MTFAATSFHPLPCIIYNVVAVRVVASRSCRGEGLIQLASSSPARLEEALPHRFRMEGRLRCFAVAESRRQLAVA